ncbi:MAG: hypothetical protein ACRENA_07140 [Vulcanimicrobiaceae bacterium]
MRSYCFERRDNVRANAVATARAQRTHSLRSGAAAPLDRDLRCGTVGTDDGDDTVLVDRLQRNAPFVDQR